MTRRVQHGRIELALHALRRAEGRPLLVLHGLGERSPRAVPAELERWPGPIEALDFTGHGESTLPGGGGYTAELLMGDADAALGALGPCTLVGHGLGAYVALLVAGGRPESVRGAILRDGPGLAGGGALPGQILETALPPPATRTPDTLASYELSSDVRPIDYVADFAALSRARSGLEHPLHVCAEERPPWLHALVREEGVRAAPLAEALDTYALAQ